MWQRNFGKSSEKTLSTNEPKQMRKTLTGWTKSWIDLEEIVCSTSITSHNVIVGNVLRSLLVVLCVFSQTWTVFKSEQYNQYPVGSWNSPIFGFFAKHRLYLKQVSLPSFMHCQDKLLLVEKRSQSLWTTEVKRKIGGQWWVWFSSVNSPGLADHLSQQCQTAMIYWLFGDSWATECTLLTCREKGSLYRRGSFLTHEIKRQNRRDSETGKEGRWDQRGDTDKNWGGWIVASVRKGKQNRAGETDETEGWIRGKTLRRGVQSKRGMEWRRAGKERWTEG